MKKFCTNCGKELNEGEVCNCMEQQVVNTTVTDNQQSNQYMNGYNTQGQKPNGNQNNVQKKKTNKAVIGAIVAVAILVLIIIGTSLSDSTLSIVKDGSFNGYDVTVEDAFDDFFDNCEWKSFEDNDGRDIVEFNGECTYYGEPADACIQFEVDTDDSTFEVVYTSINDESCDIQEMISIIMEDQK